MKRLLICAALTLTVSGIAALSADAHGFRFFNRGQSNCQPYYVSPCCNPTWDQGMYPPGTVVTGQGIPNVTGQTNPPPVDTKYTSGAEIKRILYGPNLNPGKDPVNLSGLQKGDIILEVDGVKVTANKILIDAKDAASKAGKKMMLKVWDPASKTGFTLALDLAAPNQLVMEFDVIPVDVTVSDFKAARPK